MTAPKIALATCIGTRDHDADEEILLAALRARGARVHMLAWDDPTQTPQADELVVIRSTWNYHHDVDRFLEWVRRAESITRVWNRAGIVAANARKTYLRDLERRGIAVVPTEWVTKGERASVALLMETRHWSRVVIKPVVSAGSFNTRAFDRDEHAAAQRFLDDLTASHDAMIQRWVPSVDGYGERSLVWIDGELTHAVRKAPRFAGAADSVVERRPIAAEERALAERILEPIASDLLYARVDVIWDTGEDEAAPVDGAPAHGTLRLMELELIEPSLFVVTCREALERLADAVVRRARASERSV